jgi:hypothetical protein
MDLPLSAALVDSVPALAMRDITIVPNGRCLLLSAMRNPGTTADSVYVACDASTGQNQIRKVVPEAARVAAVYGSVSHHLSIAPLNEDELGLSSNA